MKNKSEVFKKELERIKDDNIRKDTIYLLNKLLSYSITLFNFISSLFTFSP